MPLFFKPPIGTRKIRVTHRFHPSFRFQFFQREVQREERPFPCSSLFTARRACRFKKLRDMLPFRSYQRVDFPFVFRDPEFALKVPVVFDRRAYDQIPCRSFSSRSCRSIGHSLPSSWLTGAPMASQTGPRIPSRIYRIGRLSHPPPPKHGGGRCTEGSGGTAPAICAARDGCTERAAAGVGSSIMRGRIDMITPPGPVMPFDPHSPAA